MFLLENIVFNETVNFLIETEPDEEKIIDAIEIMMEKSRLLKFSNDNTKVGENVATFSLPAGWTCPFAKDCKMKVGREGKTREVGEDAQFMCYAAWMEIQRKYLRENRWHNYDLLNEAKSVQEKANLIIKSLSYHFGEHGKTEYVRIHESGDFYNGEYLQAWVEAAKRFPNVIFYAYTKSLPFLLKYKEIINQVPNFKLNISAGSAKPELEGEVGYPVASVFQTPEEVLAAGQLIDLDDSIARDKKNTSNFALLVHGMQTKELDTPDITKNRLRNEVFMKYYKYKNKLNELFGFDTNHVITNEEAKVFIDKIKNLFAEKKLNKGNADDVIFMLNNAIKFNNYNFDNNLINTIPEKFR
jgi:hypothetical protein